MNGWTARLPGVPTWGIPVASSTPRSLERRTSDGPLLASAPGGVPPMNRANPSLRKGYAEPLSPKDEVSTLASGARAGLTGRARVRSPLKTYFAGEEQGLTARPSPLPHYPPTVKGLSMRPQTAGRRAGGPTGLQQVQRPREPRPTDQDEEARVTTYQRWWPQRRLSNPARARGDDAAQRSLTRR